jgi:Na+/proline symporter
MDAKIVWLVIFVALYWSYCLFWGIKGALTSKTATDYMIAGRGLGLIVFVLAATATSFSGWTFIGHPGLIYRDGFQYAYASFYAITIPFTGVMFLKRQWMLGKRYGFVTPGEMLAAYLRSDATRLLTVLVALAGCNSVRQRWAQSRGGAWTGIMVLTYMFALMGIQSAPAFSMWAFTNKTPAGFPYQQVWASSFGIGLILFVFTAFQGIGGHFLGADMKFLQAHPEIVNNVLGVGLGNVDIMETPGKADMLVPQLIWLLGDTAPWLVGLLSICALAAMQSTGSAYMSTAGSMITRDILRRYIMPNATDTQQKFWGRTLSTVQKTVLTGC